MCGRLQKNQIGTGILTVTTHKFFLFFATFTTLFKLMSEKTNQPESEGILQTPTGLDILVYPRNIKQVAS